MFNNGKAYSGNLNQHINKRYLFIKYQVDI